jgi:adenylate cyclase
LSDIFISYARATAAQAGQVADALRQMGYDIWRDDELPANRPYAEVIAERLSSAKAVVVVWSAEALKSQWVQSEADRARAAGKLVQLRFDDTSLPMPFDRIQCADLAGWTGDLDAAAWRQVVSGIAELLGAAGHPPAPQARRASAAWKLGICVLPFANMSADAEQEYFSDGISEDIITDLSKVSALSVISRNSAFQYKGKHIDLPKVARELNVSHVLEGSVRKAGGRVRITAQLINGATNDHIWAERWDRDLTDIFALQDEISQTVVAALKLELLPQEKKAIEQRGTISPDAYNLYLMARQYYVSGNLGDVRREEAILRLCRRATEIDPEYGRAWALMARAQTSLHFRYGRADDGLAAAERALLLDPDLAEPHAVKARHLREQGRHAEAKAEIEVALRLDPESYEVNLGAGYVSFRERNFEDAVRYYEKAAGLMEADFHTAGMVQSCFNALGDEEGARRAARMTLERAETAVAHDQSNGSAIGFAVTALATLGETKRAREWIDRALLIDPDNMNMRYNFACALTVQLKDTDAALELLGPLFSRTTYTWLNHAKKDPDLDAIREDPRFQSMIASAEQRLANSQDGAPTES